MPFCGWAQISFAEQIENYHFVTIHFRGKPSVLPTFIPDLPHVAFAKRSAITAGGRPTEEDNKENVQKGPSWCWGPVWPRRESYHIQIIRETKFSITGSLSPGLLSAAWAVVRNKSERSFLKQTFEGHVPRKARWDSWLLSSDSIKSKLYCWPCSHWLDSTGD